MKRAIKMSSRHMTALAAAVDAQPSAWQSQGPVSPKNVAMDYGIGLAEGRSPAPPATETDLAFQSNILALGAHVRASRAGQQIASFDLADALFAKLDAEANAQAAPVGSPQLGSRSVSTARFVSEPQVAVPQVLGKVHALFTDVGAPENQGTAQRDHGGIKLSRVRIGVGIGAVVTTMFAAAAALALFLNSHSISVAEWAAGAKPALVLPIEHTRHAAISEPTMVASGEATNKSGPAFDEAVVGRIEAPSSVSVFYVPALDKAASSVVVWISDEPQKPATVSGDR